MRILLLFSLMVSAAVSFKVFMLIPLFGHSHVTFLAKMADILTDAGHDVTVLLPMMDLLLANKTKLKTKKVINIDLDARLDALMAGNRDGMFKKLWTMSPSPTGLATMARNMSLMFGYSCDSILREDDILAKLKLENFDVGISEPFNFCGFGLMEQLNIKTTIAAFSGVNLDVISYYLGEPSAYSYVPTITSTSEKMNVFQKTLNILGGTIGFWMFNSIGIEEGTYFEKKYGSGYSGHGKLLGDVSFSFVNANPYLDFPRPLLHKTIQIGGITVDVEDPGKLDEKWDKVLSERKKNVFISFGSVAKSKDMPDEYKKNILEVCASMPDVTFIWKYEEPSKMADHLPNVHLSPWLPQKALLADERLNLFITHGGLGSTTEVAYLGKPAIFIPLFAEQPRNAAMLKRHGTAFPLHKEDLGLPEKIRSTIEKVLNDDTYKKNAKKLAEILRNQPIKPKDLMLNHIEFAARFGPLTQLSPYGKELSIFEYYLLDVALLVISVLVVLISVPILLIRRFCCGKKVSAVEKAKKVEIKQKKQ